MGTKELTCIKLLKYNTVTTKFDEVELRTGFGCSCELYVCRDPQENLMFMTEKSLYFIHKLDVERISLDHFFNMKGKVNPSDLEKRIKLHNTVSIYNRQNKQYQ